MPPKKWQGISVHLNVMWSIYKARRPDSCPLRHRLALPHVPCLNVGTPRKPIYLPAEVCTIAPGQRRVRLDEKQTAAMIKTAAQKPDERAWNIERSVNEKGGLPNDPHVRAFGMSVEPSMIAVRAFPPLPFYLAARVVQPQLPFLKCSYSHCFTAELALLATRKWALRS